MGRQLVKNDIIILLKFDESTRTTKDNVCGCITKPATRITLDNINIHILHNRSTGCIYGTLGIKVKHRKINIENKINVVNIY